ncbi:MAG: dTDP-glucose 4,6-dehydratase [Nitrospinae bacterium]|nr:dTDP-glucose 4,6-dehydratase [Nitrospinota bacterium]
MKYLITGGAGFIGSHFVKYILKNKKDASVVNFDLLTYAGNLETLAEIENLSNYTFVEGDICDKALVEKILKEEKIDIVVNFAAESHVDRSITGPEIFVKTNILGTQVLLEAAKKHDVPRYIQISTDEVYGSLGETGFFTESSQIKPNSPYSASKAGADMIVMSYYKTYGYPVNITRCSNNYGPFHFPEKLIPLFVTNLMEGKKLPMYGDGLYIRDWLFVTDHCKAIDTVIEKGKAGEVYNIGGNNEKTNMDIARYLLDYFDKDESSLSYVPDRPGHDRRYAIDASKIKNDLGWEPEHNVEDGLKETIEWYINNEAWWKPLKK